MAALTNYPQVNDLLHTLLSSVREILGQHFVGMYLYGSLATGDFDEYSDIDFLVVTNESLGDDNVAALKALHAEIAAGDSKWAIDLEGSYIPRDTLRRYSPTNPSYPNLQRGAGRTLDMQQHERVVERRILLERGIVLAGPPLPELIDPVTPLDLRESAFEILDEWMVPMLDDPAPWDSRGYQSITVLTLCRILYTLELGDVASKPAAMHWAKEQLPARWAPLIERAWIGRQNSQLPPEEKDVQETREFIRYTSARSKR